MKIKTAGFLTALTVFFSVFSAAPITVSAEYAGTAYTFEDFVINYESGGLKNGEWTKQTDDGVYLRFSAKWYDLKTVPAAVSVCPVGTPDWTDSSKIGLTAGKAYTVTVEYRHSQSADSEVFLEATLLKNGSTAAYSAEFNSRITVLRKNTEISQWRKSSAAITVPKDFESPEKANIGISLTSSDSLNGGLTFDIRSVTVERAPESEHMEIDFGNYTNDSQKENGNRLMQNTAYSSWEVCAEGENKYIRLTKSGVAEAFTLGKYPYTADSGLKMIVNEAAAGEYYNNRTPYSDIFAPAQDTKYYITVRYRLEFAEGVYGLLPIKMMHTGYRATGSASLIECGIENGGYALSETDEWKTVSFSAVNRCTGSEHWGSFGLSFYDESVKDKDFILCIDKVTIGLNNTMPESGDVNADGNIDILDLIILKKYCAGAGGDLSKTAADLDSDTAIGAGDTAVLRRFLLGDKPLIITDTSEYAAELLRNGYSYTWGDEFNSDTLDTAKWDNHGGTLSSMIRTESEGLRRVKGGKLQMRIKPYNDPDNADIKYAAAYGVKTANTMAYRYGYLEMRAKMSFIPGVWHSLWLQTLQPIAQKYFNYDKLFGGCLAEVDVFEIHNTARERVTPNLHLWRWDNAIRDSYHVQAPRHSGKQYYTYENTENLSNEYHIYGFLWTPREMTMYIDNEPYITYDLTQSLWDKLENGLTEAAIHAPMDVIIGIGLSTPENVPWGNDSMWLDEDSFNGIDYTVDYVRLYQSRSVKDTMLLLDK